MEFGFVTTSRVTGKLDMLGFNVRFRRTFASTTRFYCLFLGKRDGRITKIPGQEAVLCVGGCVLVG